MGLKNKGKLYGGHFAVQQLKTTTTNSMNFSPKKQWQSKQRIFLSNFMISIKVWNVVFHYNLWRNSSAFTSQKVKKKSIYTSLTYRIIKHSFTKWTYIVINDFRNVGNVSVYKFKPIQQWQKYVKSMQFNISQILTVTNCQKLITAS